MARKRPTGTPPLTSAFGANGGPDMLRSSSSLRDPTRRCTAPSTAERPQPLGWHGQGLEPVPQHPLSALPQDRVAGVGRYAKRFSHRAAFLLDPVDPRGAPSDEHVEGALHV